MQNKRVDVKQMITYILMMQELALDYHKISICLNFITVNQLLYTNSLFEQNKQR
jgi:hypothetical protein